MKSSYEAVCAALRDAQSVLIFAHRNPDGDAIGSSIAMGLALKALCKKVDYAVDYDTKKCYALFDESKYFKKPLDDRYDCALVLDCSTMDYIYNNELLDRCDLKVLLDHHRTNEGFADVGVIEPDSAASGELVYLVIEMLDVSITREMANAIYVSLVEDTGNFQYSNTTRRTHEIASKLYSYSDDFGDLSYTLRCYDSVHLRLMQKAMQSMEFYRGRRLGIIVFDRENCDEELLNADTDGIIDIIRYLKDCMISVLIKEGTDGLYKVSMRSTSACADVSVLAKRMHGGGHKRAAGFSYSGKLENLKQLLIEYTEEIWTD